MDYLFSVEMLFQLSVTVVVKLGSIMHGLSWAMIESVRRFIILRNVF